MRLLASAAIRRSISTTFPKQTRKHVFLNLYEAANEEEAAKVAMISLSLGALSAETWTLLPYHRYVQLAKEV